MFYDISEEFYLVYPRYRPSASRPGKRPKIYASGKFLDKERSVLFVL